MKKEIHPQSQLVLFIDTSCGAQFLCRTNLQADRTAVYEADGKTYPAVHVDTSSASHPTYTGKERVIAKEGRVARFQGRFKVQSFSSSSSQPSGASS